MLEQTIMPALTVNAEGHLTLGGCDLEALADQYGTPCYVMDEATVVNNCRAFQDALARHYQGGHTVAYASKALACKELYRIMAREGMGIDVVSGGELYTALAAGFPADRVYVHGNNKTAAEIDYALTAGVRRFVVDNEEELATLNDLAHDHGTVCDIAVRIRPGIDAHTHEFIQTGQIDSKFGVSLANSEAVAFIRQAQALSNLNVVGLHCHIGSQIFEAEPFALAVDRLMQLCRVLLDELNVTITELNLGGGFGIKYIESHDPRDIDVVAQATANAVKQSALTLGLPLPHLVLEPGRAIVGNAGLTLYTVGTVKVVPDIRTYVVIDGGMADNPRYALYEAPYDVLPVTRREGAEKVQVTVAGRFCESSDLIVRDYTMPEVRPNDRLAVLATGAYNYSMASHYNRLPNPPIIMITDGAPRVIVKRENYADVCRNDC